MPLTPRSPRASRTSSVLKGLMIALINFMSALPCFMFLFGPTCTIKKHKNPVRPDMGRKSVLNAVFNAHISIPHEVGAKIGPIWCDSERQIKNRKKQRSFRNLNKACRRPRKAPAERGIAQLWCWRNGRVFAQPLAPDRNQQGHQHRPHKEANK